MVGLYTDFDRIKNMRKIELSTQKISEFLFYAFVFIFPWQTVFFLRETFVGGEKFQYKTIGIYLFHIILILLLLIYFVPKIKKISYEKSFLNNFTLLFIGWSFLSIFWSEDKYLSLFFSLQLLLGGALFFLIRDLDFNIKKATGLFVSSVFIQGLIGLVQFFTQSTFSNKWLGISEHLNWKGGTSVLENTFGWWLRAYGGFPHPNIFGGFLVISLLLGIWLYIKTGHSKKLWRRLLIIVLSLEFLALLFSFSRSAWIGLAISLIILFTYFKNSDKKISSAKLFSLLLVFIAVFSIFLIGYFEIIFPRIFPNSRLEKKSINDRLSLVQESHSVIAKYPIFGVGIGNYANHTKENNLIDRPIWEHQPVHNTFLLIFSELGMIGFYLFLGIVVSFFWEMKENFSKNKKTSKIIFLSALVALSVSLFFDHWLWTSSSGILLFWFLLGLLRKTWLTNSLKK